MFILHICKCLEVSKWKFFFFLSKKNSFGVKALKSDLFTVQHDLPYPNRFIPYPNRFISYPDRKHVKSYLMITFKQVVYSKDLSRGTYSENSA